MVDLDMGELRTLKRRNMVGNVPMDWYKEYPHIGYDIEGKQVMRPAIGDELDKFLAKMDDPYFWKTVTDPTEMNNIVLTQSELEIIHKLQKAEYADPGFDPYPDTVEWFTSKTEKMPISSATEPKSRFLPSKWEATKVAKIARAIRRGWIVAKHPKSDERERFFDPWDNNNLLNDEEENNRRITPSLPAPRMILPGHEESYNPPPEYVPSAEEIKKQEEEINKELGGGGGYVKLVPKIYSSMRLVPGYINFIKERFDRCLDLYMCPRAERKQMAHIDPESLIPKLPDIRDLEPFPQRLAVEYRGHTGPVRSISISPSGQFLLSGSDDCSARLWEVSTGRCLHIWRLDSSVVNVSVNPNQGLSVGAIVYGDNVMLVNLGIVAGGSAAQEDVSKHTQTLMMQNKTITDNEKITKVCEWRRPGANHEGAVWILNHKQGMVSSVNWHKRGDYFTSVVPKGGAASILIHQLSKNNSQQPFRRSRGIAVTAQFHPTRPQLILATQRHVRVYDLQSRALLSKFLPGAKSISSISIHSTSGENVIVGTHDKKLCWWDMELGSNSYKTLRYHKRAIRDVSYHSSYPLFASCADDGIVQVFYGKIFTDLVTNPMIVPVKGIKAHDPTSDALGALSLAWHPTQPWLISSGSDNKIKMWVS